MVKPLELRGLRADNPQGWMAAVGLITILHRMDVPVLIEWRNGMARLYGLSAEQLVAALTDYLKQGSHAAQSLSLLPISSKRNKSALDFTAGRVKFEEVIHKMSEQVTDDVIERALFRPWRNQDAIVSLGWDPNAVKKASLMGGLPNDAPDRTELGGQWLAAESLTVTSHQSSVPGVYQWQTWQLPLDFEGVLSVVLAQTLAWCGQGYQSNIALNGGFKYFLPAQRVA